MYTPPATYVPAKQPRPRAVVGGALLVGAAVLVVLGCILPWVTGISSDFGTDSLNGFDYFYCADDLDVCMGSPEEIPGIIDDEGTTALEQPGILAVMGAVLLFAFGVTLLAAGRVLAIAIIALVASAIGLIVSILFIALASIAAGDMGGSVGIGAVLQLVGAVAALAGSIVALAQRKRPQPALG